MLDDAQTYLQLLYMVLGFIPCAWLLTAKAISEGTDMTTFVKDGRIFLRVTHDGTFHQGFAPVSSVKVRAIYVRGLQLALVDADLVRIQPFASAAPLIWDLPSNGPLEATFEVRSTSDSKFSKSFRVFMRLSCVLSWHPIAITSKNS